MQKIKLLKNILINQPYVYFVFRFERDYRRLQSEISWEKFESDFLGSNILKMFVEIFMAKNDDYEKVK